MNFEEVNQYLLNIPRFTQKNEPERTKAFLQEIGDFSKKIPTVHVAGTNGKGSVCAYLRAGLMECGLRVGMFTSPHLVDIRERFMINHEMISEIEFVNCFNYVMELLKEYRVKSGDREYHPTFFEYLFFMAAVWFKNKPVDVVVLETGLGGRLDATNSIESPKVCVITEIGLDHCEYLGNTKALIAYEKAGIIKPNVPVVYIDKNEGYEDVIRQRAKELNSKAFTVSKDTIKSFKTVDTGIDFLMQSLYDENAIVSLSTRALYQIENASLAYITCEVLSENYDRRLDSKEFARGFANMKWPGRMETISGVTIDGAHNEDGIKAFLESVKEDKCSKRALLYSAVADKDVELVVSLIKESGLFDSFYVCKLSGYRAASLERFEDAFKGTPNVRFFESVEAGLGEMLKDVTKDTGLYVAGSLYLVGEVIPLLKRKQHD